MEVVGEAEDGRKALEQAEALNPDLVLMDSRMPKLNGFKASRLLLERMPHLKVIILAVFDNPEDKQAAEECGACGYVQKLNILEELLPAIRAAFRTNGHQKMPRRKKAEGPKKIPVRQCRLTNSIPILTRSNGCSRPAWNPNTSTSLW